MTKLSIAAIGLLAVFSIGVAAYTWVSLSDVRIDVNGWIAMGLGIVATLALGLGLIALMLWSERHGYDERAGLDPRLSARREEEDG